MDFDDVPWATFTLAALMTAVHIADPGITPLTYTVLAPWIHAGWSHLWQNLLVFLLLGAWVERRVGWGTFLFFTVTVPYLALYLPVAFDYGGLSKGASGLTMALTGYLLPVLLVAFPERIELFKLNARELAIGLGILLVLSYLITDSWVTVQRFVGFKPRPEGVSVSSHMTGLVLGVLWFGWRTWRHGLNDG